MSVSFNFDFKNPDYISVFNYRLSRLQQIRKNPEKLSALKLFYKDHPAQFITDWGVTFDPRNVEKNLPSVIPFILFKRQEEWIEWLIDNWKNQRPGITDKSREMGMSWMTVAVSCTLALFNNGIVIGLGSRKELYVDKKGDLKSLLEKARYFMQHIPKEFKGGWDINKHSPYMRIHFPETGSLISGEAGDNIGRGDRASIYFVDESAWLPRPDLVEASLSQTTNCRQDISTPRGMNNPFARKRFSGKIPVFSFRWQDDPRKNQEWYDKKCNDIGDSVVIAQEIDLDYQASQEGVLIPSAWVNAAIDAHIKLGILPSGVRKGGLDIADEGPDLNAFCGRYGFLVEYVDSWRGKGSDIFETIEKTMTLCDVLNYHQVVFDSDGVGASARGDARKINETRKHKIEFMPFRGSGEVLDPDGDPFKLSNENKDSIKTRTNEDFFANAKAQNWWALRERFKITYRAVVQKKEFNPDDIISISSDILNYHKLINELSQPTYSENNVGKIIVNKMPNNMPSPNLADAVMIAFARNKKPAWGFGSENYI